MFCSECKKQGLKSEIYIGGSFTTNMFVNPFYDEEGKYHIHDINTTATNYVCSNGHKWVELKHCRCPQPNCGFNKD